MSPRPVDPGPVPTTAPSVETYAKDVPLVGSGTAEVGVPDADDLLRVVVRERARAGLREEVTELLPNALEVRIDPEFAASVTGSRPSTGGADRSPGELFREYLGTRAVDDRRVEELFAQLHDRIGDIALGAGEGA